MRFYSGEGRNPPPRGLNLVVAVAPVALVSAGTYVDLYRSEPREGLLNGATTFQKKNAVLFVFVPSEKKKN